MKEFKGLVVRKETTDVTYQVENIDNSLLSDGNVLIKVMYSSVNYKDMLAVQTRGGVIRNYPMIPGIDLSGVIVESNDDNLKVGQNVIVTGYEMGMTKTGGFAEYAQVPSAWVVPLPESLTLKQAMIYGTAGLTAALSIHALEQNGMHHDLDQRILITGASGGVGSVSLRILSHLGYKNITAFVRKENQIEMVKSLGATDVILAEEFDFTDKSLARETFDYILDTVGGSLISKFIPYVAYNGSVSLCGNAGGLALETTVLPFILRGINLLGIDSVNITHEERVDMWNKLSKEWQVSDSLLVNEIGLDELVGTLELLKAGQHLGRSIVKMND